MACGTIPLASTVHAQDGKAQEAQETRTSSRGERRHKGSRAAIGSIPHRRQIHWPILIDGQGFGNLNDETYTIAKCEKLPEPDAYRLTAKIKYGETDGEFPMDLKIVFAGNTPVITLDQVWIPGLGTFSSRVLVHQGRYSGTWDHDAVGGHLFGKIEPASDKASETSDADKGDTDK